MGCGKSKHDVASYNTVLLQRKKSTVDDSKAAAGQEINGTETKPIINNNNNNNNSWRWKFEGGTEERWWESQTDCGWR